MTEGGDKYPVVLGTTPKKEEANKVLGQEKPQSLEPEGNVVLGKSDVPEPVQEHYGLGKPTRKNP